MASIHIFLLSETGMGELKETQHPVAGFIVLCLHFPAKLRLKYSVPALHNMM